MLQTAVQVASDLSWMRWIQDVHIETGLGEKNGYGSQPWHLVNPKIAGQWVFIPLKLIIMWLKQSLNHPFGSGLYHLFLVIWVMVDDCFTYLNKFWPTPICFSDFRLTRTNMIQHIPWIDLYIATSASGQGAVPRWITLVRSWFISH